MSKVEVTDGGGGEGGRSQILRHICNSGFDQLQKIQKLIETTTFEDLLHVVLAEPELVVEALPVRQAVEEVHHEALVTIPGAPQLQERR
jgi:hypothetical protein